MKLIAALGLILCLVSSSATSAELDGERKRVVCFGDSITKRGYHEILAEKLGVEAIMAGVAGHSSAAGLRRMRKDVLDNKPDVVVICFGTNDARVDASKVHVPVRQYEANLVRMVEGCESVGAKVVICTLPPINEEIYLTRHDAKLYDEAGGIAGLWETYRQAAIRVSKKHKVVLVDLNRDLKSKSEWLSKDGVHPSPAGTRIIGGLISEAVAQLLDD